MLGGRQTAVRGIGADDRSTADDHETDGRGDVSRARDWREFPGPRPVARSHAPVNRLKLA